MRIRKLTGIAVLASLTLVAAAMSGVAVLGTPVLAANDRDDLQSRLENLASELEKKRQEYHIPGMAIAVVKDDQIVFARGFGVSNMEKDTPVTPQTLFAIGSTSKAFTATLVGMLVDEGKMGWDDPITKHIPFLQFPLENKNDHVTVRDMLSHRSGYSRNDMLWFNGQTSRDEILHDAINAEAFSGFREKFNYNNVMYLGAGVASARAADSDWDSLLEDRLLKPLGMSETTSRHKLAQQNTQHALGYMWDGEAEKHQQLPMRDLANIAPAGGINSTVLDMAKWVRFNLAGGVYDGQRLISEKNLNEMQTGQIKVSGDVDYGLGWFLRDWRGQPVVEHGGSIHGFAAQVALLPESNLGFVLLTNVGSTPLQQLSMKMVWEHLLDEKAQTARKNTQFYAQYEGDYIANFGSFRNDIITFFMKDNVPAIDVPGQQVYTLKDPNADGEWVFELTDKVSVSFDRDDAGKLTAMRMHQGGMNFELPRKGVPIIPQFSPEELQKYLGKYTSSAFKGDVTTLIQNHRLAVDIPGEMVFELYEPDADGRWHFRVKPEMGIGFETDKSGKISALSLYRGEKKMDTAPRAAASSVDLPSVDEIIALRQTSIRKAALAKAGGMRISGTMTMAQAGVGGKVVYSIDGVDRYRVDIDFGKNGQMHTASNADGAATDGIQPYIEYQGKYLEQVRNDHPLVDLDWRDFYQSIEVLSAGELDGKKGYTLALKGKETPAATLFIDGQTGDVLKRETRILVPGGGRVRVKMVYADYREIHGLRIPFKTIAENQLVGRAVVEYETVEANLQFDPELFVINDPK